jgi:hypothetical protein
LAGLEFYRRRNPLNLPAESRLAFRELGLAIGLRGMEKLQGMIGNHPDIFDRRSPLASQLEALRPYGGLGHKIEIFWLERSNRESASWMAHRDINMVMLATSLAPEGYLTI